MELLNISVRELMTMLYTYINRRIKNTFNRNSLDILFNENAEILNVDMLLKGIVLLDLLRVIREPAQQHIADKMFKFLIE